MSGVIPVDLSFPQLGFLYFKQFASLVFQTVCVFGLSNSLCLSNSVLGISNSWCPWSFKQSVSMVFQTVCVLGLSNSLCPWSNSLCPWSFKQFVSLVFQTVCVPGLSDSVCPWSFKQLVSMVFQTICVHGLSNNLCPWSFKQFVKNKKKVAMHKTKALTHTNSLQTLPKIKEPIDQQQFKSTCPAACGYDINQWNYFFMKKLCPHLFKSSSFFLFSIFFYVICLQMKLHWYFVSLVQIRL